MSLRANKKGHIPGSTDDPGSQHIPTQPSNISNSFLTHSVYGTLIPPVKPSRSSTMGNTELATPTLHSSGIHIGDEASSSSSTAPKKPPPRSILSTLLDEEVRAQQAKADALRTPMHHLQEQHDEADTASGPQAPRSPASRDAVVVPAPPTEITTTRRCFSSKELGTLAPPSGSPYTYMLQQKAIIETQMAERLKSSRESAGPNHHVPSSMPVEGEHASSKTMQASEHEKTSSTTTTERMTNELRNRRRAEHNRAVIKDLVEIVSELYEAESKLLNPSHYGLDSKGSQSVQIRQCVERFVESLPPRYALGVETPSEVLLHMRLVAAVKSDSTRPTVHITNLKGNQQWHNYQQGANKLENLRLVTVVAPDATGLLEYITKLLASGGSRVLDADVMLSRDMMALDRFVVEMNGRLRLDKLASCIEHFLQREDHATRQKNDSPAKTNATQTQKKPSFPVSLYYSTSSLQTASSARHIQQEIETAVPLTAVLTKNQQLLQGNIGGLDSLCTPIRHQQPQQIAYPAPSIAGNQSPQTKTKSPTRTRRPLVNRRANPDLGPIISGAQVRPEEDTEENPPHEDVLSVPGRSGGETHMVSVIAFEELVLMENLGSGRVSTIYRAAWKRSLRDNQTAHLIALKVAVINARTGATDHMDELRREADIASRLSHPNVCDLIGVAADEECFCLAYEFCEGGSLLSLLLDHSRYYQYLPIAMDIANGMAYLHSRDLIHRDLKPSNVVLAENHRAKVADFGMSVANAGQELTAETGTYRYMAPEVIRHESYSSNADVYSFGICLWQLVTREIPFASMTPMQAAYAVAEGLRPTIPDSVPHRIAEIIAVCWEQDSKKRPSFTWIAMALADYAKQTFSPATVGTDTLKIANEMLVSVEGNSNVNVDFTTVMGSTREVFDDANSADGAIGLEI